MTLVARWTRARFSPAVAVAIGPLIVPAAVSFGAVVAAVLRHGADDWGAAGAEGGFLSGRDHERLLLERRPHFDDAFEDVEDRFPFFVDFDVELRAADGKQRARRLDGTGLAAGDLVEGGADAATLEREDDAGRSGGEGDAGGAEDLEAGAMAARSR